MTFVSLLLLVVVDAYKQQVVGVLRYLGGIFLTLNLIDSGICILVVFQFHHHGGLIDMLPRNEDQVGKTEDTGQTDGF